jgi:hypothetical protein
MSSCMYHVGIVPCISMWHVPRSSLICRDHFKIVDTQMSLECLSRLAIFLVTRPTPLALATMSRRTYAGTSLRYRSTAVKGGRLERSRGPLAHSNALSGDPGRRAG